MKDEVTVWDVQMYGFGPGYNVILTRQQIEQAMKELNEPEFKGGDIVTWGNDPQRFVVVTGPSIDVIAAHYGHADDLDRIWVSSGTEVCHPPTNRIKKVGSLNG